MHSFNQPSTSGFRCCCSKYPMLDEKDRLNVNGIVHTTLGPADNFCGPEYMHTQRALEGLLREAQFFVDYAVNVAHRGDYAERASDLRARIAKALGEP